MKDNNRSEAGTLRLLRQKIQHLEGFKLEALEKPVFTGLSSLDESFPSRSFPVSVVHEFAAPKRQMSATLGFASALMARIAGQEGYILWITKSRDVFPPGLALFGLEPHRIIFMSVRRDQDALWAMEEGLRCQGLSMAVVEIADTDLTATRRLQLKDLIEKELTFIEQMNYASYFLTVFDIVRFARSQDILCQGRGSAANSAVCFCLGITNVDPTKFDLLFERFVSSARDEPPDIDVDFEHDRREEVMQYVFNKYGRDRAAIVATVTEQAQRGAIRDIGRGMGMSFDTVSRISSSIWQYTEEWFDEDRVRQNGVNIEDQVVRKSVNLAQQMLGMPRQLGQHTGGFVITNGRLSDLVPIMNARMENRTCIEWDKDDIDKLGFMKIDVLSLGMLTCIRKGFDLIERFYGRKMTLANIPQDDPKVYDMISAADTIGVFQIESRAQQNMLPRMKPRNFYDLVIEVAIVRPGPIQGDMVHPYLKRRNGEEEVDYPSEELKAILERTLGIPLFQEQAMQIAMVAAGFTAAEADALRRSMATFKFTGMVKEFQDKLVGGMTERGYSQEYAERIFRQLEGFGSYGFPESHAASFAHLVYASSWIKCYYPDVFACAILNSQPMGFYAPAQLIRNAREHGVVIRPVDINHSHWDNTLEEMDGQYYALRCGLRQVTGFREQDAEQLIKGRNNGYKDIESLWHAGVSIAALELLADADSFNSIDMDRRKALWQVSALAERPADLFKGQEKEAIVEQPVVLPELSESEHVVEDYATMKRSLRAHPVSFIREKLRRKGIVQTAFREVSDELAARETLDEQLKSQRRLVAAAQKVYDNSDTRYKSGIDSFLSVLDAQRELYVFQQNEIQIERQRLANLVNLYKVLGGGSQK